MNRRAKIVISIGVIILLLVIITSLTQFSSSPKPGTLTFVYNNLPDQYGLVVSINKAPQSGQNIYQKQLVSGQYQVQITKPGYKTISETITILSDQTTIMNVNMQLSSKPAASDLSQIYTTITGGSAPSLLSSQLPSNTDVVDTRYFDNQTWAIVTLNIINASGIVYFVDHYDSSSNRWTLVTGPNDDFTSAGLQSMPADVRQYINSNYYVVSDN